MSSFFEIVVPNIAKQIRFAEKSSRLKWRDLNNSKRFLDKARNDICKPDLFGYILQDIPSQSEYKMPTWGAELDYK